MPTLQIRLLGDFAIAFDGTPLTSLNSQRLQALLSYLVLHRGTPQPRQRLAFQFWPDTTEAQARANLRFFLHRLRRALPDADRFLLVDDNAVQWRLDAPLSLDVADFEAALAATEGVADRRRALERAVELYRGDLLPGCYDDWILAERERLRQRFLDALERLVDLLETCAEYRAALAQAQRLLRYDPVHEGAYRRLMRLHRASGDRVGALRVYHTCAAVLQRELGVEPASETQAEYQRLLREAAPDHAGATAVQPGYAVLKAPGTPPNNLPVALTSFIGRERELGQVRAYLVPSDSLALTRGARGRLLTLTGTGGSGKTRLALEVATDIVLTREFGDGVWWVDLAGLADPALVPQAVAKALSVHQGRDTSWGQALIEFLQPRSALVVLDNCEHLIAACTQLAQTLLGACPALQILATSREPLGVAGETVWSVAPLSLPKPHPGATDTTANIAQSEAVQLFCERAASALPTFALTSRNAPAIAEICRQLDGMPLAIELAATRVKVLAAEQIAERLTDRFKLLTAGSRAAVPRHRSLRTAIDWSYDLLTPPEQALFRRLSAFAGGFTLEAAEAVCAGQEVEADRVLELLASLVDKSLVVVDELERQARYRLLETLREYARGALLRSEGEEPLQRHAAYFAWWAETADAGLQGPQQPLWFERLEREHDNLRAALQWALERDEADTALQLCGALGRFWNAHGHQTEGRRWIGAALAKADDAPLPLRARALRWAGQLAGHQGDYAEARRQFEASLAVWRALGDKRGVAEQLVELGILDSNQGDPLSARERIEAGLQLWRGVGDKQGIAVALQRLALNERNPATARPLLEESLQLFREVGMENMVALVLNGLGEAARAEGDYERATALYQESIATLRRLGDKTLTAVLLNNLGYVAHRQGDEEQATASFTESLRLWRELGTTRGIPESLAGLAAVVSATGRFPAAVHILSAAAALRQARGDVWDPADLIEFEQTRDRLQAALDKDAFASAWAEGQLLPLERAIEYALKMVGNPSAFPATPSH